MPSKEVETNDKGVQTEIRDLADMSITSNDQAVQACFETGDYADMTITCGDRTWKVHKLVVCSKVASFAKAVHGKFKARSFCVKDLLLLLILYQEARHSCIELVDDDPSAVDAMLRWLYYGTSDVLDRKPPDMHRTLFLARSYTIADKYLLSDLREMAGRSLRTSLIFGFLEVEELLALVEELFAAADESSKAVSELLRTWVIAATYFNYTLCFHSSPSHLRFRDVAFSRPDFLIGVMDLLHAEATWDEDRKMVSEAGFVIRGVLHSPKP
ncbi:hypothetical protein KC333_g8081 [Hortaea werneckii]|nr:hypothetical protein KC333_g8081 [Hortaea werneckii]